VTVMIRLDVFVDGDDVDGAVLERRAVDLLQELVIEDGPRHFTIHARTTDTRTTAMATDDSPSWSVRWGPR
jgi:hypothetical protein